MVVRGEGKLEATWLHYRKRREAKKGERRVNRIYGTKKDKNKYLKQMMIIWKIEVLKEPTIHTIHPNSLFKRQNDKKIWSHFPLFPTIKIHKIIIIIIWFF